MLRCGAMLLASLFLGVLMLPAQSNGVWLDVPYIRQEKDACGAASIAMVMEYWQAQRGQAPAVDPALIQRALYSPQAHGIYATAMQRYFLQNGFRAFAFRGDWALLAEHLAKGRPLIIALKAGSDFHYVVVVGLNPQEGVVLENDPARRKLLQQDRSDFERQWSATGTWTLLAVPQQASEPLSR